MMTQLFESLEIRQPFRSRLDELAQGHDAVLILIEQSQHLLHDDLGFGVMGISGRRSGFGGVVVETICSQETQTKAKEEQGGKGRS